MRLFALALFFALTALGASAPLAARPPAPVADWLSIVVKTPEGVRIGNPDAPIKLVEYGSRSCPICGLFASQSGALRSNYVASGKVSWEFRDFPVHTQDVAISTLGMCVSTRNFFHVLDLMYERQHEFNARAESIPAERWQAWGKLPTNLQSRAIADALGYTDLVRKAGMPEARIGQCFNDVVALRAFGDRLKAASARGVRGTPTFFVNGKQVPAATWIQLEPYLQSPG